MEFHPYTLSLLSRFKTSSETEIKIGLLTLLVDSKPYIDIEFIYKLLFTFKKNVKCRTVAMAALKHTIDHHFEYNIYKYIDGQVFHAEKIGAFSHFVLPENMCAILQLKNDSEIVSEYGKKSILRMVFTNREKSKKQLLKHVRNTEKYSRTMHELPSTNKMITSDKCHKVCTKKEINEENSSNITNLVATTFDHEQDCEMQCQSVDMCPDKDSVNNHKKNSDGIFKPMKCQILIKKKRFHIDINQDTQNAQDSFELLGLSDYIKKEKTIQMWQNNSENIPFQPITYTENSVLFRLSDNINSQRIHCDKKLTYLKFHDTIRPADHIYCDKFETNNSLRTIPHITNYDVDSDMFLNDSEEGESINYATESSEFDSVSSDSNCSWIEEDSFCFEKKDNSQCVMLFPSFDICFSKDPREHGFHNTRPC